VFGHLSSASVNGVTTSYLVDPFGIANVVGAQVPLSRITPTASG
jgi:hypothetical protein